MVTWADAGSESGPRGRQEQAAGQAASLPLGDVATYGWPEANAGGGRGP